MGKKTKKSNKDIENDARKIAISKGITVGNVCGLAGLRDRLVSIWGNSGDFPYRRSLVMCDGINLEDMCGDGNYLMPYGKHKGMSLRSIGRSYCEWLLGSKIDEIMVKGVNPDIVYYELMGYFEFPFGKPRKVAEPVVPFVPFFNPSGSSPRSDSVSGINITFNPFQKIES